MPDAIGTSLDGVVASVIHRHMADHPPTDRSAARDQVLTAYLAERDEPCRSCGYNLRGVTSGTCPECGKEIDMAISIGQVDQPTVPWFLAIIAYGIAAGISGMYAIILSLIFAFEDRDSELAAVLAVLLFTLVSAIIALVLLVRRRVRMWRTTRRKQWLIVASVLLVPLLAAIGIAIMIAIFG